MDLTDQTDENIEYMIAEMKKKLQLVNQDVIRAENYATDQYEELKDVYEWVMSKPSLSVSEMEAVLSELGDLRTK
ncbi:MAG TPA: DUF1128 domain-containing protein [Bacillales bacterium]|jgi:uncharacterized protein YfkK (UPF0435 family)|nr:DUF1128 domain-containing protein [Bacillales bacterium]